MHSSPHRNRGTSNQGFALITALVLMVVLVGVMNIMFISTLGEIRQTRAHIRSAQARAVAEAGEVYGQYIIQTRGPLLATAQLNPLISNFMDSGNSPEDTWIIPEDKWTNVAGDLEATLNADTAYTSLPSTYVNGLGEATVSYSFSNFRGAVRSLHMQQYVMDYALVSSGTAADGVRRIEEKGVITLFVGRRALNYYLFLVEDAHGTNGFFPTGTVFDGPVHANHNWGFRGAPVFKGPISTSDDKAYYYDSGDCSDDYNKKHLDADSWSGCTVPDFQQGFQRGVKEIELPSSGRSQQGAALGLDPDETGPITEAEKCNALGVSCGGGNLPDGVYLANDGSSVTGGIYVEGGLDVLELAASGDGEQLYTFIEGDECWLITVNYADNTTQVVYNDDHDEDDDEDEECDYYEDEDEDEGDGGDDDEEDDSYKVLYDGVPQGHAPIGGGATGQIFVNGEIDELRGPGRNGNGSLPEPLPAEGHPVPAEIGAALSLETQLNITATGKIEITSDLVYECDPTQLGNSGYLADNPRCDLSGSPLTTVLGVMSTTENIEIDDDAPDDIFLWGAYMAGAEGKGLTVEDYKTRDTGTMYLYGSIIQWEDKFRGTINSNDDYISGYRETFDYDLRFTSGQVVPPNFPTVSFFGVQSVLPLPLSFKEF